MRIKDLPHKGHPYKKCLRLGLGDLSDTELLVVTLRTGSREGDPLNLVDSLLALGNSGDGLLGLLHRSLGDFMGVKGVGKVKRVQLLCIGELPKRIWKRKVSKHAPYFRHPEGISDYYMEDMRHLEREEIRVMFLNTKQVMIRDQVMARGTVNVSVMTPREVLMEGLRCRAVSIVLVHNHPSGDPTPSRAGTLLIERLKEAGESAGTTLIDHVVIGDRCYLSFRKESLMQEEVYPWKPNAINILWRDLRCCACYSSASHP